MKYVICDIDGTISKVGDRLRFILDPRPDWDSFYEACFEDEPIEEMIDLVNHLSKKYTIVYLTGRRESVRLKTVDWILEYRNTHPANGFWLLMRPNGDTRHDTEVKPEKLVEWMEKEEVKPEQIAFILEDRNSMVKKWRELGYTCLQVADGDF